MRYKPEELKNTILLTHKNCSDGSGSAVVFMMAGGKRENIYFVPAGHGIKKFAKKKADILSKADRVIIADVATDPQTADELNKCYDVVIIDHHKTALDLADRDFCIIDMSMCGTALLYNYLYDSDPWNYLHHLVMLTNDRDMWIRKEPESDRLSLLHSFWGQERYIKKMTYRIQFKQAEISSEDHELLQILEKQRDEYIKARLAHIYFSDIEGVRYGYCFVEEHQSLVLHEMLESHDCDVAMGIKLSAGMCSIRTTNAHDASLIASEFGGGGHARAAGFPISKSTMQEIIEVVHQ